MRRNASLVAQDVLFAGAGRIAVFKEFYKQPRAKRDKEEQHTLNTINLLIIIELYSITIRTTTHPYTTRTIQ